MKALQTMMIKLADNLCLYLCYKMAKYDGEATLPKMLYELSFDLDKGYVSEDGTVQNANAITGKSVVKCPMNQAKGKYQCVNYKNGAFNHWVLYKDGKLWWNSLETSQCVNKGEPDYESIRDIR